MINWHQWTQKYTFLSNLNHDRAFKLQNRQYDLKLKAVGTIVINDTQSHSFDYLSNLIFSLHPGLGQEGLMNPLLQKKSIPNFWEMDF